MDFDRLNFNERLLNDFPDPFYFFWLSSPPFPPFSLVNRLINRNFISIPWFSLSIAMNSDGPTLIISTDYLNLELKILHVKVWYSSKENKLTLTFQIYETSKIFILRKFSLRELLLYSLNKRGFCSNLFSSWLSWVFSSYCEWDSSFK